MASAFFDGARRQPSGQAFPPPWTAESRARTPQVPGARSGYELRGSYNAQNKIRSFKPWLAEARGGVTIDEPVLRAAAAEMDVVPDNFLRLLDMCRSAQLRGE